MVHYSEYGYEVTLWSGEAVAIMTALNRKKCHDLAKDVLERSFNMDRGKAADYAMLMVVRATLGSLKPVSCVGRIRGGEFIRDEAMSG